MSNIHPINLLATSLHFKSNVNFELKCNVSPCAVCMDRICYVLAILIGIFAFLRGVFSVTFLVGMISLSTNKCVLYV